MSKKESLKSQPDDLFGPVEALLNGAASPGIRPGLERIERLLELLGNPQNDWPSFHVVGTNGKGSTCAFIASVLKESGYRTAFYSSPHLVSPGERLLIDGHPLTSDLWMRSVQAVVKAVNEDVVLSQDPPSYFELVTAAAFLLTSQLEADVSVVEAGLGGRLDATNLLGRVVSSVVTSVSMDHMEFLGDTLEKIAGEKFAVLRRRTPASYLGDNEKLIPLFRESCREKGAFPFVLNEDAEVRNVLLTERGGRFDFFSQELSLVGAEIPLIGEYQVKNASLALMALSHARKNLSRISEHSLREGLRKTVWPGRLEVLFRSPLLILDGGHNPDGVKKLTESVRKLWAGKKLGIVYAAMHDKDYSSCLALLHSLKASFYATTVPGMKRALEEKDLLSAAEKWKWENLPQAFASPLEAVKESRQENDITLVCGSLYLIGWLRPKLMEQAKEFSHESGF